MAPESKVGTLSHWPQGLGEFFFGKASKRAIGGGGEDGRTIAAALPWPPYGGVGAGEASLSSGAREPSDSLSPQWSLLRRLLQ